jgi:hypothetical protein
MSKDAIKANTAGRGKPIPAQKIAEGTPVESAPATH